MNWTMRDIAYIKEHAPEGAEAIANALGRSSSSVKMKASRMGISLMRYVPLSICPVCGRETSRMIERQGFCDLCKRELAIKRHREDIARLKRRQAIARRSELAERKEYMRIARNLRKQKSALKTKSNTN